MGLGTSGVFFAAGVAISGAVPFVFATAGLVEFIAGLVEFIAAGAGATATGLCAAGLAAGVATELAAGVGAGTAGIVDPPTGLPPAVPAPGATLVAIGEGAGATGLGLVAGRGEEPAPGMT